MHIFYKQISPEILLLAERNVMRKKFAMGSFKYNVEISKSSILAVF